MAKQGQKKKNIRLRRQIRKTLGSACLITALLVAAIPVPETSASTEDPKMYTWESEIYDKGLSKIPVVEDTDLIYATGDGQFQFAWVNETKTSNNKIAVILGYTPSTLPGGYLKVPDTVDAYTKYNLNDSTTGGYVAVSRSNKPLYYMSKAPLPILDVSGNETGETTEPEYSLCYYEYYNVWKDLALEDFYYKNGDQYVKTEQPTEQWIRNITVRYIGNQSLIANPAADDATYSAVQSWVLEKDDNGQSIQVNENPLKGVFAGAGNIEKLEVGENLMGIGNYAFYNCTSLQSIELGNGLSEIGKFAFANCIGMTDVSMGMASIIQYISDHTFYNCQSLQTFKLPRSITMICDYAFQNCSRLTNFDTSGTSDDSQEEKPVNLSKLGYGVFKGCSALSEITLPNNITEGDPVYLNVFEDCSALKHVTVKNTSTTFKESDHYKVDAFKADVPEAFYFEAKGTSSTHEFTKKNAIAFKYADEDKYEKIIADVSGGNGATLTYQVNSQNELLFFNMTGPVEEVEIPSAIGPYGISAIDKGSFSGNCFLKKIKIPATVTQINEEAFKGCHNLEHVIFEDASTITHIGSNAFATQVVALHGDGCTNKNFLDTVKSPVLTFTGEVGSSIVPFTYAMSEDSNINAGNQEKTYITYYSGWPTNLEIRYVVDEVTGRGKSTLIDYPAYTELTTKYTTSSKYPYIEKSYTAAASEAIGLYEKWKTEDPKVTKITSDQWDIINAALEVSVPDGVNAIATGLFSGKTGNVVEKDGVSVVDGAKPVANQSTDTYIQKITFADIDVFEPYSFTGCTSLEEINITGGMAALDAYAFASEYMDTVNESGSASILEKVTMYDGGSVIRDYAFCNNPNLVDVTISATVDTIGKRPFKDCPNLEQIGFSGSPYFSCENAVVYGLDNGSKDIIVQCLESRGQLSTAGSVSSTELAGITELAEEAFMDCIGVGSVDLSKSYVENIPVNSFRNTTRLYSVQLPVGCRSISKDAFFDSTLSYIDIPSSVSMIVPEAFNTTEYVNSAGKYNTIEFYCEAGSAAEYYANEYDNIIITDKPVSTTFKVIFWGMDGSVLDEQDVLIGNDAVAPEAPSLDGYRFTGWLPAVFTAVSRNMDIVAQYEKIDSTESLVAVTFVDHDDTVLKVDMVAPGKDAEPPVNPTREGYTFTGWRPAFTNIQSATTVYAQYEKVDSSALQHVVQFIDWDDTVIYIQKVDDGADAISPSVPGREGYTFTGWRPAVTNVTKSFDTYAQYEKIDGTGTGDGIGGDGTGGDGTGGNGTGGDGTGGTGTGDGTGNGDDQTTAKYYTLTVQNGSGSGSYIAGSQPIVIADDPESGMQFSHWTIDPDDTDIASKVLSATVITMPDDDVTVTAHYKKATGSSTITGTGNSSNNNSNRPGTNSGTITNGGTTVVIDKNGLSNTGVVSATVNGSSDDFTIKITESSAATEEVIKALMAEYGDISNIKYFPMDITLYDSTGKKKITDTKGLSISITLPLPDSLITYAGNNKVAGVVNSKLDKLSAKFTTISGVSCVTFTAEHFSPYVIYVDTQNLTAGTITDSTPKTGDGIHPKWFLSIGLACLSVVLFMKKDRKVPAKVRVRA